MPTLGTLAPSAPGDAAPEGVTFVGPEDSPNGRALLLASNEISGTVSVYQILTDGDDGSGTTCIPGARPFCLLDQRFRIRPRRRS